MRKIICMLIIVMVIVSMAVPAYAVTPSFDVPDIPDFSGIKTGAHCWLYLCHYGCHTATP